MADYPPPSQLLPSFNPAVFRTNETPLTIEEAEKFFLRFPTAQGTENLASVNVSGTLTTTKDSHNLGFGYQALSAAVDGSAVDNTAFGYQALKALTLGDSNTAFGDLALAELSGTSINTSKHTAVGHQAGMNLITGEENTYVGFNAGKGASNYTLSSYNTAVGVNTLENIGSNRSYNTAVGANALNLVSANENTGVGYGAGGVITSGITNTCIGIIAGVDITTGSSNTAIGGNSGDGLITGSSNTFIGKDAGTSLSSVSTSTAIGAGSTVGASNTIVLGTASETVRFNTLKPLTDTSDMTIGAGSTGDITFNISETNPLRIGTTTPMVNFQSSWYFLGPAINKTLQNMFVTEFFSAGAGLTKTYYRSPINFIPRFFTVRTEDTGTFTGTDVTIKFTVYKNNLPGSILGETSALSITSTSDILSGTFSSAVSTDNNNDAIYIGLTLGYTTLTALNRNYFICFYGQQTP